jgi:hypothetical protein
MTNKGNDSCAVSIELIALNSIFGLQVLLVTGLSKDLVYSCAAGQLDQLHSFLEQAQN